MRKALLNLPFLRTSHRVQARALDAEMLESRVMFSASPIAETALNVNELLFSQEGLLGDGSSPDTGAAIGAFGTTDSSASTASHQSETIPPESSAAQKRSLELVFVDANTPDYQRLLDDLLLNNDKETDRAFDVYLLDSSRDGVEQISEILSGYRDVDSVHILSHGADGRIQLGSTWLDSQQLLADAGRIALWGESLSENADLLIYGCSLAESEQGVALIEALASLTQADVAASDDPTGHRSLGGNWELEYASGEINTIVAVSAGLQEQWFALLETVVLQEGLNGYSGTVDTYLKSNQPQQDQGNSNGIEASASPTTQALIRFDDLFGYGPGQIPYGSTITSAQLTLDIKVGASREAEVSLHRLLVPWTDQDTWDSLVGGIALDGVEATVAPESTLADPRTHNFESFNGLIASLQAWSDGESNYGWVIVNNSNNKIEFRSSEAPQIANRPQLVVTYEPPSLHNTVEAVANSHTSDNQQTDLSSRGSQSAVAVSPTGESVVVWSSENQDGSGWGVYAQRFGSNGHAIGSEFRINQTTTNDQRWASVAVDRTGSFVVTWTSFGQDGTAESVYARRFDASGNALTNEFRVNSFGTGAQRNSVIGMDKETGEFVIAWQGAGPGDSQGVFFRRFHADGSAKDVADRIATTNTGLEVTPAVSMTANGSFVIFWIQENTLNDYLYFQQFLASGAPLGNGVQQVDHLLSNSAGPSVAADALGNFVVTYREQSVATGVWTQRYNADGTRNGTYIFTAAGDAVSPSISMNRDGSFMVAYHMTGDAEGTGIFVQKYHANGTTNGSATLVNASEQGNQTFASIASLDANNFVTSWTSSAGGDNNIVVRQFGTAGSTPLAISDHYSLAQDTTLSVPIGNGLLANDIDPNSSPLSAVILSGPAHGQLTVNPLGLHAPNRLTSDPAADFQPVWSPDGAKIAFVSTRNLDEEIYVMDADGTNLVRITDSAGQDLHPSWSPDGSKLAFTSNRGGSMDIWVTQADGSNATRLTSDASTDHLPHWSPDGSKILFSSNRPGGNGFELWLMNADGSNQTMLTSASGDETQSAWSPRGDRIAFVSDQDGTRNLYTIDPNGNNRTQLTFASGNNSNPSWSPDGSKILFQSDRDGSDQLYAMNADGSGVIRLSNNTAAAQQAHWSPRGDKLVYQSINTGNADIYVASLVSDGSFSYRPNPGFYGNDSFTYLASNGANDSVGTIVNLSVYSTNVAPTDLHLSNSEVSENVDSTAGFAVGNLTATDANPQDSFSYSIVGGADATKFSIGGAAGDQLILTDGILDFENQSSYQVRIQVTDASASTFEKEFIISVIDLNDHAPEITQGQSFQISEAAPNGTILGTIAALDADANTTLRNWSIASGNDAGVFALDANTGQLTLVDNSSLHFASTSRYHLNLTVSDGVNTSSPQQIMIQVLPSGTLPVAVNDTVTTDINIPVNIDVKANDADPELQPLTILDVTSPSSGSVVIQQDGTIRYSPAPGFLGSDTFDYVISDLQDGLIHYWNLSGQAQDTVGGNHGTIQNGALTVAGSYGQALWFDETNDHVRIPDFAYNDEFTVSFKFKLDEASGGFYQYLYSHGDPDTSNSLNIIIGENSRPGFAGIMKTVFGDSNDPYNVNVLNFDVSSAIGDGQWHSYTLTVDATTGARVYLDGVLRASAATRGGDAFNPAGDLFLGAERDFDPFRYFGGGLDSVAIFNRPLSSAEVVNLSQGTLTTSGTASASVSVTVIDRPPTANAGLSYSILEGSPLTLDATSSHDNLGIVSYGWDLNNNGLFAEPGEPTGPQPTVTWETLRNLGIANDGTFTIGLRVTDTQGASHTAMTTLVVSNVTPTFVSDPNQTIRENNPFTTNLVATDPADSLSYSIIDGADAGQFTLDPVTGELRLVNIADFESPLDFDRDNVYEVVVQVSDGLASATQTVFLRVLDENESPQATNDVYTTAEDATLSVAWTAGILANDTDPEGGALTATLISTTNHGILLLQNNGTFTYTPSAHFHGVDTFTYQTFDGSLLSNTATVTLHVTSVNDAPQIQLNDTQLTYVGQALPITIDAGLQLSDLDSTYFTGATVTIQNRDPLLSDQLLFTPSAGITGAFDAATGQLTLSGVASVADYQNALRSVQLQNMSATPHAGVRTLVFSVSDGTNSSSDSQEIAVQPPLAPPQDNTPPEPSEPLFISDAERLPSTPAFRTEQDTEETATPDSENSAPQQVLPAVLSSPELDETTNSRSSGRNNELEAAAEPTTSSVSINTAIERNTTKTTETDELLYSSGTSRQTQSRIQGTRFSVATTTSVTQSYETPFDPLLLWDDLLQSNLELQQQNELDLIAAGSVVGASGAFTVGYVLWTIRSGLLATSLLAQMPAWRLVDPLMVLDYLDEDESVADEKQDESVGEMLEQSNASHQKLSALRDAQPAEELT